MPKRELALRDSTPACSSSRYLLNSAGCLPWRCGVLHDQRIACPHDPLHTHPERRQFGIGVREMPLDMSARRPPCCLLKCCLVDHKTPGLPCHLPLERLLPAWRAERLEYIDEPYTLRADFHQVEAISRQEMIRRTLPLMRSNLHRDPGGPGIYGSVQALRRLIDLLRTEVPKHLAGHLLSFALPLAVRRKLDAAAFLSEGKASRRRVARPAGSFAGSSTVSWSAAPVGRRGYPPRASRRFRGALDGRLCRLLTPGGGGGGQEGKTAQRETGIDGAPVVSSAVPREMEAETPPIGQMWLRVMHRAAHGGQVSVQMPIVEGAQLHLHGVCSPDDSAWQLEERRESAQGGLGIGGREVAIPRVICGNSIQSVEYWPHQLLPCCFPLHFLATPSHSMNDMMGFLSSRSIARSI